MYACVDGFNAWNVTCDLLLVSSSKFAFSNWVQLVPLYASVLQFALVAASALVMLLGGADAPAPKKKSKRN